MADLEFINPNNHPIQIAGPSKKVIVFKKFEKKVLPAWFKRYCPRYLAVVDTTNKKVKQIKPNNPQVKEDWEKRRQVILRNKNLRNQLQRKEKPAKRVRNSKSSLLKKRITVGRPDHRSSKEATKFYKKLIEVVRFPISNDIGVGILSYNRLDSVTRLIESIRKHTDLSRTTIFVSDESDDMSVKEWLRKQKDIILIDNEERLGIAGNTNRLLRCLERFEYKILLNDDVEILQNGWDNLYPALMKETGYHHFCMRQPGIHGASHQEGKISRVNEIGIQTIWEKPHGAVMAFNPTAFEKVGYFDEGFGLYGMEHVDWSNRVSISGIQPDGFHDAIGSDKFFLIHGGGSSLPNSERLSSFKKAKDKWTSISKKKDRIYINPSDKTKVSEVTYIIPFQGRNRNASVRTVIQNVKAQRYPRIEIIVVEQDENSFMNLSNIGGVQYYLAKPPKKQEFTKAIAFNLGVSKASCKKIILHDADMIVQSDYTIIMNKVLNKYDSCHIGRRVMYMNGESTVKINKDHKLDRSLALINTVGYFEGGSLGCLRDAYFSIVGLDERYVGYGVEDCEFFERLKSLTNMYDERSIDFVHLAHGRTKGWEACHKVNKRLYAQISKIPMESRRKDLSQRFNKYR